MVRHEVPSSTERAPRTPMRSHSISFITHLWYRTQCTLALKCSISQLSLIHSLKGIALHICLRTNTQTGWLPFPRNALSQQYRANFPHFADAACISPSVRGKKNNNAFHQSQRLKRQVARQSRRQNGFSPGVEENSRRGVSIRAGNGRGKQRGKHGCFKRTAGVMNVPLSFRFLRNSEMGFALSWMPFPSPPPPFSVFGGLLYKDMSHPPPPPPPTHTPTPTPSHSARKEIVLYLPHGVQLLGLPLCSLQRFLLPE